MASNKAVELRNPLSEDHVALRPNLISGLLDVLNEIFVPEPRVFCFLKSAVYSPTISKRGTASWDFTVGKCRKRIELAISDKTKSRLV